MKRTLEQLQHSAAWQDPANREAVAKALGGSAGGLGALGDHQLQQDKGPALVKAARTRKSRKGKLAFIITIVSFGPELLDEDNCATGAKPLRDNIAASLGVDDGDGRVRFQYGSVYWQGQPGTVVTIHEV